MTYLFCGIPTAAFASSLVWYERLFGRPPDRRPHENEAVWQLTESGLVYLVADAAHAGHALLTLMVDDLEAQKAELSQRGIEIAAIETLGSGARKMTLSDPDGNSIAFGDTGPRPG